MSIISAREMMFEAAEGKYAVGAFNITNLIQMEAVVEAAVAKKAPLIIQTSVTPAKFLGADVLVAIYRTLAESAPIPICLHLDHSTSVEYCIECADVGYTNLMIDASKQDYEENIRQTKQVVDHCHALGLHVSLRDDCSLKCPLLGLVDYHRDTYDFSGYRGFLPSTRVRGIQTNRCDR